jgi:4-hydroxy 2-oxovalerate aldolase
MDAQLLECTVRDGSNEVKFQWTAEDVATMSAALDRAGFAYIEAGHGWAMGANAVARTPQIMAREGWDITGTLDDEAYFRVIRRVVRNAKIGALFAPGVLGGGVLGTDWIEMAADCGLGFLRIGIFGNTLEHQYMKDAIRTVKDRGLLLSLNILQTYLQSPDQIADLAKRAVDLGADWIYVVDSAGCMVPDEVARYVETIHKRVDARIGFHGHNNIQMAVANCLAAIDAGATLIDCSLQGIGRATGNPPTESLLGILQNRKNLERNIDQNLVFSLGRTMVRPWVQGGFDPTHVLSGIGKVHSDRLHAIAAGAQTHGLGIDDVLVDVGQSLEREGILSTFTNENAATACAEVAKRRNKERTVHDFSDLVTVLAEQEGRLKDVSTLVKQLKVHAFRDRLSTALLLVRAPLWPLAGPSIVVRGRWALGAIPCDRVDLSSLEDFAGLDAIYADERLPGARATESIGGISIRSFSLSRILAEASTMRSQEAMSLVACDDSELARDLSARLWRGRGCVVLETGQAVPQSEFTSAYLQGRLGLSILESPAFRAQLRPGMTLQLLGAEPMSSAVLHSLGKVNLRLPDVWSVFVALATLEDAVEVVDGTSIEGPTEGYQIIAGSGELVDWHNAAVIGRWAPLAAQTDGDRLSIPTIRSLYGEQIARHVPSVRATNPIR